MNTDGLDATQSEKVVTEFLDSWKEGNIDSIMSFFTTDAVYHNVPVEPITGAEGIRQIFVAFLDAFQEAALDIVRIASKPDLVIAERVDRFLMRDGKRITLPVTGVFELKGGKITRFSDYFDLGDFERQSGMKL